MKYQFVTSMHRPYFDHIGSVMIESWLRYWKNIDCELVVYGEDFYHEHNNDKIKWKDWGQACLENFKIFSKNKKGSTLIFAKKGFAFLDAMKNCKADRLIWIDADLLFFKEVPIEKFDRLLSNDKLIAFFDQYFNINPNYTIQEYTNKEIRNSYGAESGFVILNPYHKNYKEYVDNYENLYLSENKNQFITHGYDSEIVVIAARDFLTEVFDLSSLRTTNKTQTPLNRSWLSEYFSHQKAKSKHQYSVNDLRRMCGLEK